MSCLLPSLQSLGFLRFGHQVSIPGEVRNSLMKITMIKFVYHQPKNFGSGRTWAGAIKSASQILGEPGCRGVILQALPSVWAEDFPLNGINRHGSIHLKEHPWLNVFRTSRNLS